MPLTDPGIGLLNEAAILIASGASCLLVPEREATLLLSSSIVKIAFRYVAGYAADWHGG